MKKVLIELFFILIDRILPSKIKAKVPLIQVSPKKIELKANNWHSQHSFFLKNIYTKPIFEIYLCVHINKPNSTDNIEIEKNKINEEHQINLGDYILNYDLIRFDLDVKTEKVILLRIQQINSGEIQQFKVKSNCNGKLRFKILGFAESEPKIAFKPNNSAAVPIAIPEHILEKLKLSDNKD